jgi:hypothetical protein
LYRIIVKRKPSRNNIIKDPIKPKFEIRETMILVAPKGLMKFSLIPYINSDLAGKTNVGRKLMKEEIKL